MAVSVQAGGSGGRCVNKCLAGMLEWSGEFPKDALLSQTQLQKAGVVCLFVFVLSVPPVHAAMHIH